MASKTIWTRLALDGSRFSRGLSRANRDLAGFRRSAGAHLRTVGVASAALAVGAGVIGAGFEQSMANVRSVTQASEKDMARLEKQARGLGSTTSFSASQASEALFNLSLQGLNVDQAIGASEASLKLAGATMSDLGESAELVAVQMNVFQKQGKTAAEIANVVTRSTQVSGLSFDRLRDSMIYAGPVAGQFNVRLEETTGALALLAKQGRFGSIAGSGLANVMLELTTNAGKYADIIPEGTLQTRGLAGVIEELEKRAVPAEEIMGRLGKRAGPTMGVLLAAGSKGLRDMEDQLTGTNAAWEAYDTQQNTVRGAALRLRSALEELAIQAFQTSDDALRTAFDNAAKTLLENSGRIIGAVSKVLEVLAGMGRGILAVVGYLREHNWILQVVGGTLVAFVAQIGTAALAVGAWVKVATFFASKMNVWILVISAVVAVVNAIVQRFGGWRVVTIQLSGVIQRFGAELKKRLEIGKLLVQNFGEVWTMLPGVLKRVFEGAWRVYMIYLDTLKSGFSLLWDIISGKVGLGEALAAMKTKLSDSMAAVVEEVRSTATDAWAPFSEAHAAELAKIEAEHAATVARLVAETREKLAAATAGTETATSSAPTPETIDVTGEGLTPPAIPDVAGGLKSETEEALVVWEEFNNGLQATYSQTWDTFLDADMTGAERRRAIWEQMKSFSWTLIGDIAKKWIWGEAVKLTASKTTEQQAATAAVQGAAVKVGASGAVIAANQAETTSSVQGAAADTFKAHARIPFVGIAIAVGLIATMLAAMKSLPKFARGGFIQGHTTGDTIPILGQRGEFVMPRAQSQEFAPLLEALRAGDIPDMRSLSFAGGTGGGLNLTIVAEQGSILTAEDDSAWERVATRLHDRIEQRVKTRYRARG